MRKNKGFTLIELLIVIGIIAILAAIIYVAVDPARRLGEARDADRWSSVNAVLNGILKFTVDSGGNLPANLAAIAVGTFHVLGTDTTGCDLICGAQTTAVACLNLSGDLVDTYLSSIPEDASSGSIGNTDYYITKSSSGRITVGACDPEEATAISVTR